MGLQWASQGFPCLLTTRPDTNLYTYWLIWTKRQTSPNWLSLLLPPGPWAFIHPQPSFTALPENLQASRKVITPSNWPVRPPPAHTCYSRVLIYTSLQKRRASLPWWLSGEEPACQCQRCRFEPWVGKILWRRKWQPTPVFFPGKSHGQRSLAGYSPWDHIRVGHDFQLSNNNSNKSKALPCLAFGTPTDLTVRIFSILQ